MKTYYLTFGQRYRREPHEKWKNTKTQYIHPDGYWKVTARDGIEARMKIADVVGIYWSNLYDKEPSKEMYPLGIIGEIK